MPLINRPSIPEEFFDLTSAMLLVQPDPQFFFAVLFKMALGAAMVNIPQGGPLGLPVGSRPINDVGAAYTGPLYDRLTLASPDPVYSQGIQVVPELSQSSIGHTVRVNRPKFGSGGFTLLGREVPQGATISTNAIDLSSEQVTLTIKRYAGPYDAVNGNVAPFAVDKLDASRAVHSVSQIVGKHLQRDLDKWLDAVFLALSALASQTLWPQGFASDSTSQIIGDMPGDADILFRAEETLKLANIPRFANGRYMGLISPTFSRQLKNDPQWVALSKYFPQKNALFQSYVGTVGGIDVFESTTIVGTNNGNSVPIYASFCFGPNFLGAGVARMPEVMPNTQDNFGETALVVWLSYLAFSALDSRFCVQMHTS